jgi:CRP/FNR family transcriptional regulator, cyclic AMP receptor protein
MTTTRQFKEGETLFREDDASEHVLRITNGTVEISKQIGTERIVVGHVDPGEFLGEMAAIENRPHSATARAASDGAADVIPIQHFIERVSGDPALARDLILRLSIRLRQADNKIVEARSSGGSERAANAAGVDVPFVAGGQLSISAGTVALQRLIGAKAIRIETLPFIVGRTPSPGESEPRQHPDLSISDKEPFRLSRDHFMIARIAGHIVVQDLESTLGTVVNGRPIGRHFASDSAELRGGENRILAGGIGSPFEFHVLAREA